MWRPIRGSFPVVGKTGAETRIPWGQSGRFGLFLLAAQVATPHGLRQTLADTPVVIPVPLMKLAHRSWLLLKRKKQLNDDEGLTKTGAIRVRC
jgi:hypothetical protein